MSPSEVSTNVVMSWAVCPGVAIRLTEPDRWNPSAFSVCPDVRLIDRPEVVEPGSLEQSSVQGVVRMMVAEHHVADFSRINTQARQWFEDLAAMGDHPGIHDDGLPLVLDQHHRAGNPIVGIPSTKHVQLRGHASTLPRADP